MSPSPLPAPSSGRWRLLRGGLNNLYRFDAEEFWYEQGHLLLRGNNGTGKSRVLALQLPFLLDGDVSPDRLEPDANPARRIEWNLLLDIHEDRLGYTWVELGRRDEKGQDSYLTLGCGLRAVKGRPLVNRWFFITKQRINSELFLQTASGHMLTQDRLAAAIGDSGQVFSIAKEYRHAVDRALFRLGEARYAALVDLLIQLRHPQLSKKFEESKISAALSGALAPVSEEVIADVADSFRSLETDRKDLETFVQAGRAVDAFLSDYRRYASIASRRAAQILKGASADYDGCARALRAAEAEHEESSAAFAATTTRHTKLEQETDGAAVRVQTLAASPQMRDAEALEAARQLSEEHAGALQRALEHHNQTLSALREATAQHAELGEEASVALSRVTSAAQAAKGCAAPVGLEADHGAAVDLLDLPTLQDDSAVESADELLTEATDRRQRAARHLRTLSDQVREAQLALVDAERGMAEATTRYEQSAEAERLAVEDSESQLGDLAAAYAAWADGLSELQPPAIEDLETALAGWAERPEGRSPLAGAVTTAATLANQTIAHAAADVSRRAATVRAERSETEQERAAVEAGRHAPPPPPHTRSGDVRAHRQGAPFWQVCDFASHVSADLRAGIEAALEAAGLLDAWVEPSGGLSDFGAEDTTLVSTTRDPPAQGQRLSAFLIPSIDPKDAAAAVLSESVIAGILERIGVGRSTEGTWITTAGGFRLGPLQGAWSKPSAEHIGHAAREHSRRDRLARLGAQLAELDRQLESLDAETAHVRARENAVAVELAAAPDDGGLRHAHVVLTAARRELTERRARLAEAERLALTARQTLADRLSKRNADADHLGLASWLADLSAYEDSLSRYRESLARLWPTVRAHAAAQRHLSASTKRLAAAKALTTTAESAAAAAGTRARLAEVHYKTLLESKGAAIADILRRYEMARQEETRLRHDRELALQAKIEAARRESTANAELRVAKHEVERAGQERAKAADAFRAFVATRLVSLAAPALELSTPRDWSLSRSIDIAREIDSLLSNIETGEAAWDRSQREIHRPFQELQEALLPHGYQPSAQIDTGVFVVSAVFQGSACTMDELRTALAEETARRHTLLDARERAILETHLIGEVAHHLHERLHTGQEFLERMNAEVRDRPMSTGMTLRFTWQPIEDGPEGLREARSQLMKDPATWSAPHRLAVGEFLFQQIRAVRSASDGGTWDDHLRVALDYRRWHHFGIDRHQDGQWKRLTKRTYGTASGGEKAVLLTVPLFVAAAAHYHSADPTAPRLILLDEAFVGIDSDMRGKCMGLLSVFDLDFIMTSEREWACYATLPGVAICQLSARPGIDAVYVSRWVWNGKELLADARVLPSSKPEVLLGTPSNGHLLSRQT